MCWTTIPQYAEVVVLSDMSETWCKTKYDGISGYTVAAYLTTKEPSQNADTGDSSNNEDTSDSSDSSDDTSTSNDTSAEKPILDSTLYEPDHEIIVYIRPPAGSSVLALYTECSDSSDLLATMTENSAVEILMVGETWCHIEYNGKQGYCIRDGLSFFAE